MRVARVASDNSEAIHRERNHSGERADTLARNDPYAPQAVARSTGLKRGQTPEKM